ncbi:hypothetical protein FSP39_003983 [Pinctada imbricata]|uniref:Histone deacetylase domain-containing protein n=1 Tax=Pinctada imbricata TaxID=66713 RepID=A0AA88YB86_PINIB|nr:hypothetical protein FSP39_003983 [Pinctada imbricata]
MLKHKNEWDPNFPECPGRIKLAFQRCVEMGLINRCTRIQAQMGTEDQVKLQHSQELIEKLQSAVTMETSQLKELSKQYDSIYISNVSTVNSFIISKATYECALLSVGSVMEMMDQVLKNKVLTLMISLLLRPPGHHAMHNEFCGFSYFNNVAIAAKHALETYKLRRILIVDWDVHHGQATQQMFYDDPRVLYFSIHRYEYGTYWPNLRESDYDFIGSGKGAGYNINIPVNQTGMGDSDYMAVFQQVLMPIANEFCPDLVLVSAGYDCAIGCPEFDPDLVLVSAGFDSAFGDLKGEMSVTPAAFAHFTHMLKSLAEGRVCVCLEGGYCLQSLAESVALTLRSLLGDPCPLLPPFKEPSDSICTSILNAIKVLRPYWKSLCYQGNEEEEVSSLCYQGNEVEECRFSEVNTLPPKEGVEFMTEKNRPKEFPLAYTYPEEVQRLYLETDKFKVQIDALVKETNLSSATNKCCLAYDEGMKLHVARNMYFHPEDPDRISRIYERMVEWGLVKRCLRVENRMAAEEELEYIHTAQHIEFMKTLEEKNLIELRQIQSKYNSIYLSNEKSYTCARMASGLLLDNICYSMNINISRNIVLQETYTCARMASGFVLDVVKAVLTGELLLWIMIYRPPGHHAERTHPMGFCFFNNIAIAAEYAKREFGLKRILILDWDVHHGNGTQHQFYEDPNVLFISLHRYDWSFFYPSSDHGNHTFVGEGPGEGFNVNIPFNRDYMGDAEYIAAFQQIVMPIAYEYGPELVLVSAGFDAAMGDPLGHYLITPIGYAHMTHMLSSLANGRVVLALEGGYNLDSISNSMARCMSVLLGDVVPHLSYVKPKER